MEQQEMKYCRAFPTPLSSHVPTIAKKRNKHENGKTTQKLYRRLFQQLSLFFSYYTC